MRRVLLPFVIVSIVGDPSFLTPSFAEEITAAGTLLSEKLDAMDVEHLWEPGRSVAWKTGVLLPGQVEFRASNTHCSAFVASTCLRMDVDILRPPEHETKGLANAQAKWLHQHGAESGWNPIKQATTAQHLANQGHLVVAAFAETQPERSGHIAIARPSDKSIEAIHREGPQIIQAGSTNSNSTSLKEGFKHHAGAFPSGVRYYVNEKVIARKNAE